MKWKPWSTAKRLGGKRKGIKCTEEKGLSKDIRSVLSWADLHHRVSLKTSLPRFDPFLSTVRVCREQSTWKWHHENTVCGDDQVCSHDCGNAIGRFHVWRFQSRHAGMNAIWLWQAGASGWLTLCTHHESQQWAAASLCAALPPGYK